MEGNENPKAECKVIESVLISFISSPSRNKPEGLFHYSYTTDTLCHVEKCFLA